MPRFVNPKEASEILGVHMRTLSRWHDAGKIKAIRVGSGQRRYDIEKFLEENTEENTAENKSVVLYARVSQDEGKTLLEKQAKELQKYFKQALCIKEIGNGDDLQRKELLSLLERVLNYEVSAIVVTSKDRLATVGYELVDWICLQHDCKIVLLDE